MPLIRSRALIVFAPFKPRVDQVRYRPLEPVIDPDEPIYLSTQQEYTADCGALQDISPYDPVTVVIPAASYTSIISQADADNQALTAAQDLAEAGLLCPVVEQYDGPFAFPSNAFEGGDVLPVDSSERGGTFFRSYSAFGQAASKGMLVPNDPHGFTCRNGGWPVDFNLLNPHGSSHVSVSGSSLFDVNTNTITPGVQVVARESGLMPTDSGWTAAGIPFRQWETTTIEEFFSSIPATERVIFLPQNTARSWSYSETFGPIFSASYITRKDYFRGYYVLGNMNWASCTMCPAGGQLTGCVGDDPPTIPPIGSMRLQGYSYNVLTAADIGKLVVRSGAAALVQTLSTYTQATRTWVGNHSRVRIPISNPGATYDRFYVDAKFRVTPTVGDAYDSYYANTVDTTGLTTAEAVVEYPWIDDAAVELVSLSVSHFSGVFDTFESFSTGDHDALSASAGWDSITSFIFGGSNSDAWDGFDVTADIEDGRIASISTGHGWAAEPVFLSKDTTGCYDDFEGYATGTLYLLNQGVGWAAVGYVFTPEYTSANDNFESYSVGAITALDANLDEWVGSDGVFINAEYTFAVDEMESYAPGAITLLDGGSGWQSNGVFV